MTSPMVFDFVVLPRIIAKERGIPRYFTGSPCSHGHTSSRYTNSKICCGCTERRNAIKHAKHKDSQNQRRRLRYAENEAARNKIRADAKKYYLEKNDQAKAARKRYYEEHRPRMVSLQVAYAKTRSAIDPLYRMRSRLRTLVKSALKRKAIRASKRTTELLGCSIETALQHLEHKFAPGMSWQNHGEWHIDHIAPLASAKTENDLYRLCHYTNLQPLWAKENLVKGARIAPLTPEGI